MSIYDKARNQKFLSFTMVLFTLAIGVLIGTVVQTGAKAARDQGGAPDATPLTIPAPSQMQSSFAAIAKRLEPSVVNISVEFTRPSPTQARNNGGRRGQQVQPDDNGDDNGNAPQDLFRRFFGGGGGGGGMDMSPFGEQMPSSALGSGVVVDKNGYILTNNHVVEKSSKITVKFTNDETEYPARVVGTDTETDLAVIKIDRRDLVAAKIGNSDSMQVGDWAVAIGSPLGFQATVTAGIVSALSRDVQEPTPGRTTKNSFQHFIQTDAAINPGNSGGPLLNINGEVIGINTMIASQSGGYQGIGFALPSNMAVKVYNHIIREGRMTRGSIGIQFPAEDAKTTALMEVYGGVSKGVFVEKVIKDSPAEKAGMKTQDVIASINGKPVNKGLDLVDTVADSEIGSTLKVGIMRDKKPMTLSVVVADRAITLSDNPVVSKNSTDRTPEGVQMKFGVTIGSLNASAKQNLGYTGTGSVQIQSVEPGSFADEIGLAKDDILLELNREAVNSPADVSRIQAGLKPGDPVAFHVARHGNGTRGDGSWQPLFLAGRLSAGVN